jgi:hypothetical protein
MAVSVGVAAIAVDHVRAERLAWITSASRTVYGMLHVQAIHNLGIGSMIRMLVDTCHDGLAGEQCQDENGDSSTEFGHDNVC